MDDHNGKLCEYREYAKLEVENARLKAEVEELKSQPDPLTAYLYADTLRRDDIKTLKAHIERLTKAGDDLVEALLFEDGMSCKEIADWQTAKEGKTK
jgi:predicted RNase H-like nuclease (RuvC/YqgF family)